MSVFEQPLFHMAVGFAGMFIAAWLFDRASARYISQPEADPPPAPPSVAKTFLRTIMGAAIALVVLLGLYATTLVFADIMLFAALAAFAVASYRARLRPLLSAGIPAAHFALLLVALGLWALPTLWFVHLHLANSYGGA